MPRYEYKVVPAPAKGRKAKGVKTPETRFALSVETVLNEMGAEGWEYLRAELLPSEERSGLTSSTTNWRNVLVFRRALASRGDVLDPEPETPTTTRVMPVLAATVAATAPPANARLGPATAQPAEPEVEPEFSTEDPLDTIQEPAAPEKRSPPNWSDIESASQDGAADTTPEPSNDYLDHHATPEPDIDDSQHDDTPAITEPAESDDESLSGIERVVRRSAKLRDTPENS